MRRLLCLMLLLALPVVADDSDLFGAQIVPNVLILFDSSGSMADEIESATYEAASLYDGDYAGGSVYKYEDGEYSLFAETIAEVGSATARLALSASGYWSGLVGASRVDLSSGNYLNYRACTDCAISEAKIDIAKRVVSNIVSGTEGVEFGVMTLAENGAALQAEIGTAPSTIVERVFAIEHSSVGTPLGDQLFDAGNYYKGLFDGYLSPITESCQPNFVLMISDGLQRRFNRELREEAARRFLEDHSPLDGLQNLRVHTVGFAIDPDEAEAANDILAAAADFAGGSFFSADNSAELEAALQEAIRRIISGSFSFAAPLIPTTSTTGSSKAFMAAFQADPFSPTWRGYLRAYARGADGLVPLDGSGLPAASALAWEAGERLDARSAASRNLYTAIGGNRHALTVSNGAITPAMLGVTTSIERDRIVSFVRGSDATDADRDGDVGEDRDWKLGDIFHSAPVLVGPPPLLIGDPGYKAFRLAQAARTRIVLAGANDGMLHAFGESDGEELWGYVPESLLPHLGAQLAEGNEHRFFVDASPVAFDIESTSGWKTIVVFGLRRGGRTLEALDITDTTDPQPLWSYSHPELGESWSTPALARVKLADGTFRNVALMGGGYDTAQNNRSGRAFLVVDLESGQTLWEYTNDGSSDDRRFMNFSLPAPPTVIDGDGDGFADTAFIGDVGGQLWKFDLSNAATLVAGKVTNWSGRRLFNAAPGAANPPAPGEFFAPRAIYAAPTVAGDKAGDLWLAFGTGDRNHPLNAADNRFYALRDDGRMTNGATLTPDWSLTLAPGEKVLDRAEIFGEVVYFSSFTPTDLDACDSDGGEARLYAVALGNGYAAVDFDDGSKLVNPDDSDVRSTVVGSGIPSAPIVTLTESGGNVLANVVVGTSSGELPSRPMPPPTLKRLLYWREVF